MFWASARTRAAFWASLVPATFRISPASLPHFERRKLAGRTKRLLRYRWRAVSVCRTRVATKMAVFQQIQQLASEMLDILARYINPNTKRNRLKFPSTAQNQSNDECSKYQADT